MFGSKRLMSAMSVLLLAGAIGISGCKKQNAANAAQTARPPAAVKAAVAETRDVPVYLDEIGKVVSIDTVSIIPQVGGKLIKAHVEDGADVKKGDLLFEIDPRPFEAAHAMAVAAQAQSKAELDLARLDFKRVEGLKGTAAISQQEVDQKQNAVAIAEARLRSAEANVEAEKLNLEYTKIYSPIDGRAGARWVVPGNIVKANDQTIMVIQRLDPIYAEFTITENDLGTVRKHLATRGMELGHNPGKGLKVEVDVPGDSRKILTALAGVRPATQPAGAPAGATTHPATQPRLIGARSGTLTFLDNAVQGSTGTVKVRATLPNSDYYFWPGQFVQCKLILTTKKDAVLIPAQAQQIGQTGPFVYVVKSDSTAELRPVTLGQRHGDMLVIDSGLNPGEKVITVGQMMVAPGAPVSVIPDAPPVAHAH